MFGRRFIEPALAVAPVDKRDSLRLGRLMSRLDAELARIPLDSGLIPARIAVGTWPVKITLKRSTKRP